jgi:hypothetical protein
MENRDRFKIAVFVDGKEIAPVKISIKRAQSRMLLSKR